MRRLALLSLAASSLLLLAAGPSEARYSPKKAMWGPAYVDGVSQFPRYRDLGVGIYQASLSWASVAPDRPGVARDPNDPAYRWPPDVTRAVAEARSYGMRVALMLITAPPWANGGRPPNWAPIRPRDYADFAYAASRRYPGVKLWMIWGEPSRRDNWEPFVRATPRRYARLLDAAYASLKHASRANRVIGGMTYTTGDISSWQWIKNMRLPSGRPPRLDLYGHNPFSFRRPNLGNPPSCCGAADFSDLGRLGRAVDRNLSPRGRNGKRRQIPLFLSEFTLPTDVDSEFNFHVDRNTQASWIRDALRVVRRSRRIQAFGWVHFYDDAPAPNGGLVSHGGLLDYRGQPKPGYYAFKAG